MSGQTTFELSIKKGRKNLLIKKKRGEKLVRTRSPKISENFDLTKIKEWFKGKKYLVIRNPRIEERTFFLLPEYRPKLNPDDKEKKYTREDEEVESRLHSNDSFATINLNDEDNKREEEPEKKPEEEPEKKPEKKPEDNKFTISFSNLKRTIFKKITRGGNGSVTYFASARDGERDLGSLQMDTFIKLLISEFPSIKAESGLERLNKAMYKAGTLRPWWKGGRRRRKSRKRKKTLLKKKKSKRKKSRKRKKRRNTRRRR